MVDVRFELTTNDPCSAEDAICEGISPLGYWQEVQTKPYNSITRRSGDSSVFGRFFSAKVRPGWHTRPPLAG